MSRYIDADIAKEKLKEYCIDDDNTVRYWYDLMGIDDCIDKIIPTADVRENVKGEWIFPYGDKKYKRCSVCGSVFYSIPYNTNFCPNCGADMRGES